MTEADKKFACEFCPMKFFNAYKLKTHRVKHTGEKRNTHFIAFSYFISIAFYHIRICQMTKKRPKYVIVLL